MVQRGGSWVAENQTYVAVLGVALVTALLWFLRSVAEVRDEGRRLLRRRRPEAPPGVQVAVRR